jgi:hypothetical protein
MKDTDRILAAEADDMDCIAEIRVKVARSGAMCVVGQINDEHYAIACLQQAIQAVKDYHKRQNGQINILVPAYDSALAH